MLRRAAFPKGITPNRPQHDGRVATRTAQRLAPAVTSSPIVLLASLSCLQRRRHSSLVCLPARKPRASQRQRSHNGHARRVTWLIHLCSGSQGWAAEAQLQIQRERVRCCCCCCCCCCACAATHFASAVASVAACDCAADERQSHPQLREAGRWEQDLLVERLRARHFGLP